MNHSDDDENSNAKYSKTTRNLALKKEKQKAYKKAYREKQKNLKKSCYVMAVRMLYEPIIF